MKDICFLWLTRPCPTSKPTSTTPTPSSAGASSARGQEARAGSLVGGALWGQSNEALWLRPLLTAPNHSVPWAPSLMQEPQILLTRKY